MQFKEIYYLKVSECVCVHFPSPLVVQCGSMPGNHSCGTQQKTQQLGVIETDSSLSKEQKQGKVC